MASLSRSADGRFTIQFMDTDGKRRSIRVGKIAKRIAETIKGHVENLLNAKIAGSSVERETAAWVSGIGKDLASRLASVGLIAGRKSGRLLGEFGRAHIDGRTDLAAATRESMACALMRMTKFLGADKPIQTITPADIDRWVIWLGEQGYALAMAGRTIRRAKESLKAALREGIIDRNPAADMKAHGSVNADRMVYVPAVTIRRVMEVACPQWQLIIALARFGGLRIPSEINELRVGDIDFQRRWLIVRSPKTKRHRGKEKRVLPMFPEIVEHIERTFDAARDGQENLIENQSLRRVCASVSLRKRLLGLLDRAGVDPWPRLFHALRGSCETDLAQRFPIHVYAAWMGHSPKIATEHYLSVTDADYEKATNGTGEKSAAQSGTVNRQALHFPIQTVQDSQSLEMTQTIDPVIVIPSQSNSVHLGHSVQMDKDGPVTLILDTREV